MFSGFQSNAFQRNAFQISGTKAEPDNGWLGGGGFAHYPSYAENRKRLEDEKRRIEALNLELALKEQEAQEAARLLSLKNSEQRQKKAAQLLAAQELRLLNEINVLRMERVRLIRLIDDEEAILVLLMARPILH